MIIKRSIRWCSFTASKYTYFLFYCSFAVLFVNVQNIDNDIQIHQVFWKIANRWGNRNVSNIYHHIYPVSDQCCYIERCCKTYIQNKARNRCYWITSSDPVVHLITLTSWLTNWLYSQTSFWVVGIDGCFGEYTKSNKVFTDREIVASLFRAFDFCKPYISCEVHSSQHRHHHIRAAITMVLTLTQSTRTCRTFNILNIYLSTVISIQHLKIALSSYHLKKYPFAGSSNKDVRAASR